MLPPSSGPNRVASGTDLATYKQSNSLVPFFRRVSSKITLLLTCTGNRCEEPTLRSIRPLGSHRIRRWGAGLHLPAGSVVLKAAEGWPSSKSPPPRSILIPNLHIHQSSFRRRYTQSILTTKLNNRLGQNRRYSSLQDRRVPGYRSRDPGSIPGATRSSDPLILVSTTEEMLGRKSSDSGLENRDYGRRDPAR
jgi:hypothetical protein